MEKEIEEKVRARFAYVSMFYFGKNKWNVIATKTRNSNAKNYSTNGKTLVEAFENLLKF